MHFSSVGSMVVRLISVLLVQILVLNPGPVGLYAQDQTPTKLNIVILEGEGAINNIRQRVARESIVQVEDENRKPVAGAVVTFFLPEQGASGVFPNGARSLTVTTDQSGRAVARGIRLNSATGEMQIRVSASFKGLTASAVINQSSTAAAAAAAGGISGKTLALIIGIAAGAAVGAAVGLSGGSSSTSPSPAPTPTPPTVVTPGTPSVGPPR
jgi:hypothetical protein